MYGIFGFCSVSFSRRCFVSVALPVVRGRGSRSNPPNRFERYHVDRSGWSDPDDPGPRTELLTDRARSVIARNDSPDVAFDASVNPYRGCEHGCAYCYARPNHEYLGLSAGLDFESRIFVKRDAPRLLREALGSPKWRPEPVLFSGVTDAYQPVERRLRITRRCLEVLAEFRNPVAITTKSYLVTRDVDVLSDLASVGGAAVTISVTSLRDEIQRSLEPRASSPGRRLGAIRVLAEAGIPVGVNIAPVIPGLTDHEIPAILEAAADAGASFAGYILLRLPHGVKEIFTDWLDAHVPDRKEKVLSRLRDLRGGRLYDARFALRGRGEGPFAEQIRGLFAVSCERFGLNRKPTLSSAAFRVPEADRPQMDLFG